MDDGHRTVGSGFTKRVKSSRQFKLDSPAELEAARQAFDDMAARSLDPWAIHEPTIARITEMLAGLRSEMAPGGTFAEREDLGWYLEEIVMRHQFASLHISSGNAAWAAHEGALMGEAISEMHFKFSWEKDALFGRDTRAIRADSGKKSAKGPTRDERIEAVRKRIDRGSAQDAYRHAGRELGLSAMTMRRAWEARPK